MQTRVKGLIGLIETELSGHVAEDVRCTLLYRCDRFLKQLPGAIDLGASEIMNTILVDPMDTSPLTEAARRRSE